MTPLLSRYLVLFVACLLAVCVISACEFDDPYVPDSAGSSTLAGRIVAEPATDLAGAEVFLHGQDSFTGIAGADGRFHFQYIPPGDYLLQMQKRPYLQAGFPVTVRKSTDVDMGDLETNLKGAIAGIIPGDKLGSIHGELELVIYANDIPLILETDSEGDLAVDLSSAENNIIINTITRITVYIDNIPYSAAIEEGGEFLAEFIPPGTYDDVRVKLNSEGNSLPIASGGPIVVKGGQIRVLAPLSSTFY